MSLVMRSGDSSEADGTGCRVRGVGGGLGLLSVEV
jgi:hypothetical protein